MDKGQGNAEQTAPGSVLPLVSATAIALALIFVSVSKHAATTSPRPLPSSAVEQQDGWVDESRCAECHGELDAFWQTGHARTLMPARDAESVDLLRGLSSAPQAAAEGMRVVVDAAEVLAEDTGDGPRHELNLDWCFGSGRHARTWVSASGGSWGETDLVEFRWSWYASTNGFAVTPGQPEQGIGGYYNHLGVLFDHPRARACFSCHSSSLPVHGGHIDGTSLKPGVTCQRCHGPRARHVASEGAVTDSFWREAGREASVNRCAECHRRADEQDPSRITRDNVDIVRFQPVGLVQSACFKNAPEMTCLSCHDPHLPLDAQDSQGIWQCVQCHDATHPDETPCGAGQLDDCLRCHMPKVRFDAPVSFTDHWIRVRDGEESQP